MNGIESWVAGELSIAKHKLAEAKRVGTMHGVLTDEEKNFLNVAYQGLADAVACIKGHGRKARVQNAQN